MKAKTISLLNSKTVCISFDSLCNGFEVFKNGKKYHNRTFESELEAKSKFNAVGPGVYEVKAPVNFRLSCVPLEKYDISKITLPKAQRNDFKAYRIVENFDLVGSPARINRKAGIIEISPAFKQLNEQEQEFILLHEKGHFFYADEFCCDLFAMVNYLNKGYNKSQAYQCMHKVLKLHPINQQRIKQIFDNLQKVKIK